MALSGRVIINPEDLRDGDGTLRRALELWSCRNGPVQYNKWQSVYFALIRDYGYADEETSMGEDPVLLQTRIRRMYREIQESIHGPDYRAEALLSARAQRVECYLDRSGLCKQEWKTLTLLI